MFKVSKKITYAIEAVIDIAFYSGIKPVQNIEIANRQGIPKRYLEQTLQSLVKNNILVGSRGPKGGYRLARERRKIKISEIIESVDKQAEENAPKSMISEISKKVINPMIYNVYQESFEKFQKISVEDICMMARKKNIQKTKKERNDFVI